MNVHLIIGLAVVNIPVYVIVGRVFFKDLEEFFGAIWFFFKPEILSALSGEYWDDIWAEIKLMLFLAVCAGAVYGEYQLIQKYWG